MRRHKHTVLTFNNYYIDMKPKEEEEISLTLKRNSGQEWGFECAPDKVRNCTIWTDIK